MVVLRRNRPQHHRATSMKVVEITLNDVELGRVDIHRVARTDPTRWIIAAKLVSVLS